MLGLENPKYFLQTLAKSNFTSNLQNRPNSPQNCLMPALQIKWILDLTLKGLDLVSNPIKIFLINFEDHLHNMEIKFS